MSEQNTQRIFIAASRLRELSMAVPCRGKIPFYIAPSEKFAPSHSTYQDREKFPTLMCRTHRE